MDFCSLNELEKGSSNVYVQPITDAFWRPLTTYCVEKVERQLL